MDTDKNLHDLGALPSAAEVLAADYPEWHIWRHRDDAGRHGDWIAQHITDRDRVLQAPDTLALRKLLENATD